MKVDPYGAAYAWAREQYGATLRDDGLRVMDHAAHVAENVVAFGRRDVEMVAAALLHDVLETTATPAAEIERRFGPQVARLVVALTNAPGEPTAVSAQRALQAGEDALFLRLCDRLAGLRHAAGRPPASREKFLQATREVYLPLVEQHFPALAAEMTAVLQEAERSPL